MEDKNNGKLNTKERIVLKLCLFAMTFIRPYMYTADSDKYINFINEIKKELD